ncbi:MAG: hypothetical protein RLZZ624_744, partial [Cyanobacteriota bacterium]
STTSARPARALVVVDPIACILILINC